MELFFFEPKGTNLRRNLAVILALMEVKSLAVLNGIFYNKKRATNGSSFCLCLKKQFKKRACSVQQDKLKI
jgi:hypothetical protein